MKKFNRIFLHHSQSEFGHGMMIRDSHVARGWKTIGYNLVILNGYPTADWYNKKIVIPHLEGAVEVGRPIDSDKWFEPFEKAAGVYGYNEGSFHICTIGDKDFSEKVMNKTIEVTDYWRLRLDVPIKEVWGHYEKDSKKICPGYNMDNFRVRLKNIKTISENIGVVDKASYREDMSSSSSEWRVDTPDEKPFNIFQLLLKLFTKGKKHG